MKLIFDFSFSLSCKLPLLQGSSREVWTLEPVLDQVRGGIPSRRGVKQD